MSIWQQRLSGSANHRPKDHRDPYQRDKARILHSAAFRRLQSKTQVLGVGQHDFYRTRLTHSLEVAQVSTGLTAQLRKSQQVIESTDLQQLIPNDPLIEALCLAHDLGHPPFGHGGEVALNYMMRNDGGFEGNGQTFRIITLLEPYTEKYGMDLTRRASLGLIKYPRLLPKTQKDTSPLTNNYMIKADEWKPVKGLYQDDNNAFEWVLTPFSEKDRTEFVRTSNNKTHYKSFDASIMELADDIAYGVHDLEDAIVMEHVSKEQWFSQALPKLQKVDNLWSQKYSVQLSEMLFSNQHHQRKNAIGALVNHLVTNVEISITNDAFTDTQFRYNAALTKSAEPLLNVLKQFVFENLIMDPEIQQVEFRGQKLLMSLFDAFDTDPKRLLPKSVYHDYERGDSKKRVICDFLASMSDEQANRTYSTLFGN